MPQVAIFVLGPAGVGKSTFCSTLIQHCQSIGRAAHLVNLDPAAENFAVQPAKDIRDLICLQEAMDELQLGPNGALVYCMEFLVDNLDWLLEDVGGFDNDFLLVDCPGQIELYTHYSVMNSIIKAFQQADYRCLATYLMECQFIEDKSKYLSGVLNAMSAMIQLEIPHINILSKIDLYRQLHYPPPAGQPEKQAQAAADDDEEEEAEFYQQHLALFLDADVEAIAADMQEDKKYSKLNEAIVELIDQFNMVSFVPLNISKESSISTVLYHIDNAVQYGEDLEPREQREAEQQDEE